jgi:hypothetical protein
LSQVGAEENNAGAQDAFDTVWKGLEPFFDNPPWAQPPPAAEGDVQNVYQAADPAPSYLPVAIAVGVGALALAFVLR